MADSGTSTRSKLLKHNQRIRLSLTFAAITGLSLAASADKLPDPDGMPADMSKPVKVFIIMGQSNTLKMGAVAGADKDGTLEHATKTGGLYPFLVDDAGKWTTRQDVRNVSVMVGKGVYRNEWLTVEGKGKIGIGHQLGNAIDAPVMILKSSIGNRGLGWDLLPPDSESWEYEDPKAGKTYVYAGYKQSPNRWEKGTEPQPIGWHAGKQYDDDVANGKMVLQDLAKHYPDAKGHELAGFLWWQGDKDMRKDFGTPKAPFVTASLGQTGESDTTSGHGVINPHFPALRSGPMVLSGASRRKQIPSSHVVRVMYPPLEDLGVEVFFNGAASVDVWKMNEIRNQ